MKKLLATLDTLDGLTTVIMVLVVLVVMSSTFRCLAGLYLLWLGVELWKGERC